MRVLHLIDTGGPGGAETIFHSLVTGLEARGWTGVAIVPVEDWLHRALTASGVDPTVMPHGGTADIAYVAHLRRLLDEHQISVVHAHLLGSAVYGSIAAAGKGVPVVCTFHGLPDFPEDLRFARLKLRIIQRRFNRLVFVSKSLQSSVDARFSLRPDLCRVIHNGVAFQPPSSRGSERAELGATDEDFLAVAVGNIRPAKDYETLLRAVARVRERGVPLHLAVLGQGSGPSLEQLEEERGRLGLEQAVDFMGFREDANRLLGAADVFVNSSHTEGFSLGTVEALGLSRSVVATRSGGPEEIVRHAETGWLVPVRDPEALADAIIQVHSDRPRAAAMARAGQADVRERFGVARMLDRYEDLYREVMQVAGDGRGRASSP